MNISRKIGLEGRDGHDVGRDPRQMTQPELLALGHEPMSPLKALRLRCIDCCAGSAQEVRLCTAVECPAWPFRMDKNPWRAPPSEAQRAQGRRLAATSSAAFPERGKSGKREMAATTLPASTAEEKNTTDSGGEEQCA